MLKIGKTQYIGLTEAEKTYGVSRVTLFRAIRKKQLPSIRYGRITLIKVSDLERWLASEYHPEKAHRGLRRKGKEKKQ